MRRAAALAFALVLAVRAARRTRSRNTRSSDFRSPIQRTRSSTA